MPVSGSSWRPRRGERVAIGARSSDTTRRSSGPSTSGQSSSCWRCALRTQKAPWSSAAASDLAATRTQISAPRVADEAFAYHLPQVEVLAGSGVDLVTALTLTNVAEAIGFVRAASERSIPAVVSFTVETDGRLPSGMSLADAIESGRCRDRRCGRVLHDQLRAPRSLRSSARRRDCQPRTRARCPRQRVTAQPRRAGREHGTRRWRSDRVRSPARRRSNAPTSTSACLADAAAPMSATSPRSPQPTEPADRIRPELPIFAAWLTPRRAQNDGNRHRARRTAVWSRTTRCFAGLWVARLDLSPCGGHLFG